MTPGIKPIETQYKGYRFRSRLEARWAVYFDTLGCAWEYEPQGFDLGAAGFYLPDFWLPTVNMWAEVKPERLNDTELMKANALVIASKKHLVHLVGTPSMRAYNTSFYCAGCEGPGPGGMRVVYSGEHVEYVEALLTAEYLHSEHRWFWAPSGGEPSCELAQKAVNAARGARFEHGETPGGIRFTKRSGPGSYERRLDGWATKVYGEDWEDSVSYEEASDRFDRWLEDRGELD